MLHDNPSRKSTILIIDDDRSTLEILRTALRSEGYDLVLASSGQEALQLVNERVPDLILLDVMMPVMNGYQVCRHIRSNPRFAEIPIIMITALSDRSHRLQSLEAGADDFLNKPIDLYELRARVKTITRLDRYRHIVTERAHRQHAEEALQESKADLERSNQALGNRVAELETLHNTSVAMASRLETEALLQFIVKQASALVEAASCSILLLNATTKELVFHASVDDLIGMRVPPGKGLVSIAARRGTPLIVHQVQNNRAHYREIDDQIGIPTESQMIIPLLVGERPIGVLTAVNKRNGRFTEHDQNLLVTLASHAAIAIENARLYEKAQKEIEVRRQTEEKLKRHSEQLRKLAQRVVSAQEEERQRLSRELHDEAGQALTALKIQLELLRSDVAPELECLRAGLAEAASLTNSTLEQLRLMAHGLHPPSLAPLGLEPTLESYCRDFARRTRIEVIYKGGNLPSFPGITNISLYRFLQEALTNIARHARASRVMVTLALTKRGIRFTVIDNGCGFDPQDRLTNPDGPTGIGLLGMQERVELLGGRMDIESSAGQGTCIVAHIPLGEIR